MTNEEKDRKEYELGILLAKEEDLPGVLALLASHHVENASEARSKRLTLAYEIKGHTEGVFASLTFKAFGDEVKALEIELTSADLARIDEAFPPGAAVDAGKVPLVRRQQ